MTQISILIALTAVIVSLDVKDTAWVLVSIVTGCLHKE